MVHINNVTASSIKMYTIKEQDPHFDLVTSRLLFTGTGAFDYKSGDEFAVTTVSDSGVPGGYAGDFNGDWYTYSNTEAWAFADNDFTFEAWLSPASNAFTGGSAIVSQWTADPDRAFSWNSFATNANWRGQFAIGSEANPRYDVITNSTVPLNEWHHYAWVREGSEMRWYIDGVLDATNVASGSVYPSTQPVRLGAVGTVGAGGYVYYGKMAELRVTNGVCRYTENFTPPSTILPLS